MAEVVCNLCTCRLEWDEVDSDELQCQACGHSLDDDHVAAGGSAPESNDEEIVSVLARKAV